jgi:hypothetical protein
MRIKPIPLAAYNANFVPPVTGIGGNLAPVANTYDTAGNFANRPRIGSLSKKRRIDEIDRVFDLSEPYPPILPPGKLSVNIDEIKTLLVAASAASEEVGPLLENPELDPKLKAFGNLGMALLGVVSAIVENGLIPIVGTGTGSGSGPSGSGSGPIFGKIGPAPPPKVSPGIRELKACLEKADTESILFDANLGAYSMGNRNGLNVAFSNGIRDAAIGTAEKKGADPSEAIRVMNDALECVSEMDFIGLKSEKTKSKDPETKAEKNHFTMPVKLKFDDRNSRLHFERTIKSQCGLRAVMSLPKPIREEQALFVRALKDRYPEEIVTARPDPASLHFIAFKKKHNEKRWNRCSETIPIPHGIVLPDYKIRKSIVLPPVVTIVPENQDTEPMSQSQSQEGEGTADHCS